MSADLAPLVSGAEELHGCVRAAQVLQGHHRCIAQAPHCSEALHQLCCQLQALLARSTPGGLQRNQSLEPDQLWCALPLKSATAAQRKCPIAVPSTSPAASCMRPHYSPGDLQQYQQVEPESHGMHNH